MVGGWSLEVEVWGLESGVWWLVAEVVRKFAIPPPRAAGSFYLTFQAHRPQSLHRHGISFRARCSG